MTILNRHAFKYLSPAHIPELATLCIIINIKTLQLNVLFIVSLA